MARTSGKRCIYKQKRIRSKRPFTFKKGLRVKGRVEFCGLRTSTGCVTAVRFDGTIDGKVVRKVTEPQRNLITFIHYPHSERRRNSPSVIRFISIVNTCPACLPLLSLFHARSLSHPDFFKQAFNEIINVFLCSCKYSLILFSRAYVFHISSVSQVCESCAERKI